MCQTSIRPLKQSMRLRGKVNTNCFTENYVLSKEVQK